MNLRWISASTLWDIPDSHTSAGEREIEKLSGTNSVQDRNAMWKWFLILPLISTSKKAS